MLSERPQKHVPEASFREPPSLRGPTENGGLDPLWLDLAFLGRPDFLSRGLELLVLKGFGTSGLKIGAPQKRQILGVRRRGGFRKGCRCNSSLPSQ